MIMNEKPFVFGVAASGVNFTDREKETVRLLNNFMYGVNTILISPRRWGKTSLVRKVAAEAKSEQLKIVYLDIFSCRSESEFYDAFATAVIRQTATHWKEWIDNAKHFLERLAPQINIGADPFSDFSISLRLRPETKSVDEILNLPERIASERNIRIVVCLDEFQQIGEFPHSKNFQKKLRGIWQLQTHTSYCLFGSKQHLMNEIFTSRSQPFYKFGDALYLSKIPTDYWVKYIISRFQSSGKNISETYAENICTMVSSQSSYVQQLSWLIWIHTDKSVTDESFRLGMEDLLAQNTALFERQTENLSEYQYNFLLALADGIDSGFSKLEIRTKYRLGSSATIAAVKRALEKKELIEKENGRLVLTDPIMGQWLLQRRLPTMM